MCADIVSDHIYAHIFLSDEEKLDLQSVLASYYDLKYVRSELLCAIRDSVADAQEQINICELLQDGVKTYIYYFLDRIYYF